VKHEKIITQVASVCATEPKALALASLSPKDATWDKHRSETQDIGSLYDSNGRYKRLGERMSKCSNLLGFAQQINPDTGEIGIKLRSAIFCKVRSCPVCSWRRGLRNIARFYERIPLVIEQFPKAQWLFLTLTVKNPAMGDLRSTLNNMNKAWKKMIERKTWNIDGYIRTTEITKGTDGNPHPHFHALLLVSPGYFKGGVYLSQAAWSEIWMECLGVDYMPVVHIQKVKSKSQKAQDAEENGNVYAALNAAVAETLKYSIKPSDVIDDKDFLFGLTDQLHKLRFLATGGVLKDFLKEDIEDEEMIVTSEEDKEKEEEKDKPKLFFNWKTDEKKYRKRNEQ